MRLLLVTEKCGPTADQRDGGARLVTTLRRAFGDSLDVLQFGETTDEDATEHHVYPYQGGDRFLRRLRNADFVAERVRAVAARYTHVLFVHVSMQFGFARDPLVGRRVWTMPMFLTPSYVASGEVVPAEYTVRERLVLRTTDRILTPSHLEHRQIVETYGVDPERVRVVPRGVDRLPGTPHVRRLNGPLQLCSVGSVKRQKNTLGLVTLFAAIRGRYPDARLRVIGPIQDAGYADEVRATVAALGLESAVEFVGYVPPSDLAIATADAHVHLSASHCETFGRAIFETLSLGLPNVIPAQDNAAAEYLADRPYARFYESPADALEQLEAVLADLEQHSAMAVEVGHLFDDDFLSARLAAEISEAPTLAASDFDGTLWHKTDALRTQRSVQQFNQFSVRVICSARPLVDLMTAARGAGATADYYVAWSGGVVADSDGHVLWREPLTDAERERLLQSHPDARPLQEDGATMQFTLPCGESVMPTRARTETYANTTYALPWRASKLQAVVRLLQSIDWRGRVRAFGDGRYDDELLTYFDGVRVRAAVNDVRQAEEVTDEAA